MGGSTANSLQFVSSVSSICGSSSELHKQPPIEAPGPDSWTFFKCQLLSKVLFLDLGLLHPLDVALSHFLKVSFIPKMKYAIKLMQDNIVNVNIAALRGSRHLKQCFGEDFQVFSRSEDVSDTWVTTDLSFLNVRPPRMLFLINFAVWFTTTWASYWAIALLVWSLSGQLGGWGNHLVCFPVFKYSVSNARALLCL